MKTKILFFSILIFIFSCSKESENDIIEIDNSEPLSRAEINEIIKNSIETSGDFNWMDTDAHTIWSALQYGEQLLTVGYGNSLDVVARSESSTTIKDKLIAKINALEKENIAAKTEERLYVDEYINLFDISISNKKTIETLLADNTVRYIEPAAYNYFDKGESNTAAKMMSDSGCGYNSQTIANADYTTIAPGARVPWAFYEHNIPSAWNYSTGSGVTVAVIDTGLSPQQSWLNSNFNDGYSSGRTVEKYGTFIDSSWWWSSNYDGVNDKCGHGTNMAAVATAPRNNDNLPVGVAYNANLVSYRAVEDVVIDDYHERKGVADALTALGNRSDVRVISMSIGSPFSNSRVSDAIKYAYNKGKMIIAAGGTSTSFTTWYGVIFPANMSQTVAVTGVKEGQYTKCDVCHSGSEIDFTIQMQRTNGTDNKIPTMSYYNGSSAYTGGSSIATATTAGIAALIWSKNPSWSRAQVLAKMQQSSEFYPNKSSNFGYGNIDALKAVQ